MQIESTNPSGSLNGKVFPAMGPQLQGYLCKASGTVTPDAGYTVMSVYVFVTSDLSSNLAWTDVVSRGRQATIPTGLNPGNPATWNLGSGSLSAIAVQPPSPNNIIYVAADTVNNMMQRKRPLESALFTADSVPSCPTGAEETAESAGETTAVVMPRSSGAVFVNGYRECVNRPCENTPTGCDWLTFDGFTVNQHNGNCLYVDGRPLRASTLAVVARNVCWRPSADSSLLIRRAAGAAVDYTHTGSATLPYRFPELPPNCIVIFQSNPDLAYAVTSHCADHPDIVSLDPFSDINVCVNDRLLEYDDNNGSFSLSVAILGGGCSIGCGC